MSPGSWWSDKILKLDLELVTQVVELVIQANLLLLQP